MGCVALFITIVFIVTMAILFTDWVKKKIPIFLNSIIDTDSTIEE